MAFLSTKGYISIDHTFKVAANLGYLRPDGRWITQYNSLFIDIGQVIAWQLTKTGNCCFSSLACSLLFQKRDILASLPTFFRDFRIQNNESSDVSVADIASELRQKAVAEWCNNYYQGFLPQGYDVQEEAMKFKQHGYFSGPLGNTMVSNAVGLPVIVLSSAHHHSVVYTVCKVSIPLWIAYNQAKAGHYNALTLRDLSQETPRSRIACELVMFFAECNMKLSLRKL